MNDPEARRPQPRASRSVDLAQVSDALRNDYFYRHKPHEHFNRSLMLLRLLTTRSEIAFGLLQSLDEAWILNDLGLAHGDDTDAGSAPDTAYVITQGLTLKFQAIETLLRHFLAHYDSPSEPWSHISQLKVPRHFSERVRHLRDMGYASRVPLVEQVFFGMTTASKRDLPISQSAWEQQVAGVDTFFEMCLRCWLDDQGPFLAAKHGYVAIPQEAAVPISAAEVADDSPWPEWEFWHITRGDGGMDWEFRAVSSDAPNVVAGEVYFASRLLQQLLDVGRIRNVPSEARTIDVIWWDDDLCERVRNGTLDITDGPPPTREWTVPHDR